MFCKWDCQLDLPSIMFMALPLSSKIYVPYTLARSSSSKRWCDNIIVYLHARGGQCGAAWIGLPERSTPFSLSSPPLPSLLFPPSLARSPLFSDHSSTAERHASHFDHRTRGGEGEGGERERRELGREGGIEKGREREHIETHRVSCSRTIEADVEEFDIYSTADGTTGQPATGEPTGSEWMKMREWMSDGE